jgi:UDP-N-acetylmuramoylalanine--D-glutamate ligase
MRLADLAGRRVAVWGVGAEGRAAVRAARDAGAADVLALVDDVPGSTDSKAGVPVLVVGSRHGDAVPADVDVLVLSPGVSRYRPEVVAARARGVRVTGGTELYLAEQGARTVAVTGSKGKSTVTRLTAHLLSAAGRDAVAAGNIGTALLDLLPDLPTDPATGPVVVAEVSSYQAALVASPPRIAVLTALFPDHLPWHGGVEQYYADKLRLLAAQLPGPRTALVNGADPGVRSVLADPAMAGAGIYAAPGARVDVADGAVRVAGRPVLPLARTRLPGGHNATNVAAAVAVLDALGIDVAAAADVLEEALAAFAPLPHRLEPVATVAGVSYVDDSLATTAQAAVAACESYPDRPLTLLVGGLDRGIDYTPLVAYLAARAARTPLNVVATGAAGGRIAGQLSEQPAPIAVTPADDVPHATRIAARVTPPGGVVLFSPAAPSPPEHGSYERRSAAFAAAARGLIG